MQNEVVNKYTDISRIEESESFNNTVIEESESFNNIPIEYKPSEIVRLNTHEMHKRISIYLGETQTKVFVSSLLIILTSKGLAKVVGKEKYNKDDGSLSSKACAVYEITLEKGCIIESLFKR